MNNCAAKMNAMGEGETERDGRTLLERIARLQEQNAALEKQVEELRPKAEMFDRYGHQMVGSAGEAVVARWSIAEQVFGNKGHDFETADGKKLEVKFSRLGAWRDRPGTKPAETWKWTHLFGYGGKKEFDRLLLVGEVNPRFADLYADPTSKYVVFDLSPADAKELANNASRTLTAHTNPNLPHPSRIRQRLYEFQVPVSELHRRYAV